MKQQTVITWLINELIQNRLMALRYDKDNVFNEIVEQAKQMEEEQEYATKCLWFGKGILAGRENKIQELKPTRNEE